MATGFSHIPSLTSTLKDEWLWGWDPTPGIVSVWAEGNGRATVWRRENRRLLREEERFRHTLKTGLSILGDELASTTELSGSTAFLLHDTYGFPLELTQEIAGERSIDVDLAGFEREMTAQRDRASSEFAWASA